MRRFLQAESGAGAVEFALVLPLLAFLLIGAFNLFMLVYAQADLHAATEATARYYSVTTAATGTAPTTTVLNAYAASKYTGPYIGASYTYSATSNACGSGNSTAHSVAASATYLLNYGFGHISIPMHANACFP